MGMRIRGFDRHPLFAGPSEADIDPGVVAPAIAAIVDVAANRADAIATIPVELVLLQEIVLTNDFETRGAISA